jgi:hypothetical protein
MLIHKVLYEPHQVGTVDLHFVQAIQQDNGLVLGEGLVEQLTNTFELVLATGIIFTEETGSGLARPAV